MTELIVTALVAFGASLLTFFSGFGLGTILLPVFIFFFEVEVAIAATAIVHLLNNLFKLLLIGKSIDRKVLLKFGGTAVAGAFLGAWLLFYLETLPTASTYELGGHVFTTSYIKMAIGALMVFFALVELIPKLKSIQFGERQLFVGGAISGFFGGLSGHQGALRTTFLLRVGLTKEAFIGTGVAIACFVDIARITIYSNNLFSEEFELLYHMDVILTAIFAAFAGAFIGRRVLKKITLNALQVIVSVMIMAFGILLALGIV